MQFQDRADAGEQLANLMNISDPDNTIVLALPRGGIPLGINISKKFNLPLDVLLAKKIGHPVQPEFAIGAVTENGSLVLDENINVTKDWIEQEKKRVQKENNERRALYNEIINQQEIENKNVIIVDDGIATGMTMFAAIKSARDKRVNKIILAVPIIPKETFHQLENLVDEVISVDVPSNFLGSVGVYYKDFPQITDDEVQQLLKELHS